MSIYVARSLAMPSGAVYESGRSKLERQIVFYNARVDLIEAMGDEGHSTADIAKAVGWAPNLVEKLLATLPERRREADAR